MKTVTVKFLQNCANWRAGDVEEIEIERAKKLQRQGYVEFVETATVSAPECTEQARPAGRTPRAERRG